MYFQVRGSLYVRNVSVQVRDSAHVRKVSLQVRDSTNVRNVSLYCMGKIFYLCQKVSLQVRGLSMSEMCPCKEDIQYMSEVCPCK